MITRTPDTRPVRERAVRPAATAAENTGRPVRGDAQAAASGPAAQRPVRPAAASPSQAPAKPARGRGTTAQPAGAPAAAQELTGSRPEHAIIIIRELTALMERENAALEAHDLEAVQSMLSLKQSLTRGYLELAVALRKDPQHLRDVPEETRAELKATAERLEPLMSRNSVLLKSRMEAVNRVMAAIVDAVKETQAKSAPTYTEGATMNAEAGEHRRMAVALNKEF